MNISEINQGLIEIGLPKIPTMFQMLTQSPKKTAVQLLELTNALEEKMIEAGTNIKTFEKEYELMTLEKKQTKEIQEQKELMEKGKQTITEALDAMKEFKPMLEKFVN